MSKETKAAFENMRFYKFYPVQTPDTPDVSNVKVRFYELLLYLPFFTLKNGVEPSLSRELMSDAQVVNFNSSHHQKDRNPLMSPIGSSKSN